MSNADTPDPPFPVEPLEDGLAARARDLTDEVSQLRLEVRQWSERTKRAEKLSVRTAFGATVVVVLVLLVLLGGYRQVVTEDRLNQAVANQDSVRSDVLCPFFALILGSYNPQTRPEGPDREQYENSFQTMRRSYQILDCTTPLVPPRAGG